MPRRREAGRSGRADSDRRDSYAQCNFAHLDWGDRRITDYHRRGLRPAEGKLAVFTDDLVQPDLVFDVYVRTLPELDQQQLSRGIRVKTYDELTSMIEDYIS